MKYNTDDMAKMQQEAVKRIQEMQNKGKSYTPTVQTLPQSPNKEKSLILLLILLLSSEKKGDTTLIFALIYLLL